MSLEEQASAIKKLGSLGTDIPGLNADSVIENIIKKDDNLGKYLTMIDAAKEEKIGRGMTQEQADKEAEEIKKETLKKAKENLKPQVEEDIIKMKQEYKTAKEAIDSIPSEAQTVIALTLVPPAISAPPSTANPAYTLGIATQTKKSLLKTLNIVLSSLTTVITLANKLKFELPQAVTALVSALTVATNALSVIPG